MLFPIALGEVILCWIVWLFGFLGPHRRAAGQKKVVHDPVARWGILLQIVAYGMACADARPAGFEKPAWSLIIAMLFAPTGVALAWPAARRLGKQFRIEAALSQDHELIQTGPYRWVRHPIYASMLAMLLATGFVWTWWPTFAAAVIVFLLGTEIRVRAEDRLLRERFGDAFEAYRSRVPAYIPFVR